MRPRPAPDDHLFTPAEVAVIFRIHRRSLVRWERDGHITALRTPGGHRRYRYADVRALYEAGGGVWPTG